MPYPCPQVKNFKYALTVEPDNKDLQARLEWAEGRRKDGLPTVPSTVRDEKQTNPFVRVREPTVQSYAGVYAPKKATLCS